MSDYELLSEAIQETNRAIESLSMAEACNGVGEPRVNSYLLCKARPEHYLVAAATCKLSS